MENPLEKFDTGQLVAELKRRGREPEEIDTDELIEELEQRGFSPDNMADGRDVQRLAEMIVDGDTREALEKLREICPVAGLAPPGQHHPPSPSPHL